MTQTFKGDALELKMKAAGDPIFDLTDAALDDFYLNGYDSNPFLLMLYDENRMPFSQRINRDAFIDFIKVALANFPVIGTFESYLFVLRSVFGSESEILFDVPSDGKLSISVNAISSIENEFIGKELVGGVYDLFNIADDLNNLLVFRGISGIETEYELNLLFSEIMPAGITPDISLTFFSHYDWIAEEGSDIYDMVDHLDDKIIFSEIGG